MRATRITIRSATPADAAGIAAVHVASWLTTYRGIVPDAYLSTLSVEQRAEARARMLAAPRPGVVSVVAEADGEIIGFADAGPGRDDFPGYPGELYAIYVLQSYQGHGIGRRLVEVMASALLEQGRRGMYLWVLGANPARHFYAALGGRALGAQQVEIGGTTLEEVAYGWENLTPLAAGIPQGKAG